MDPTAARSTVGGVRALAAVLAVTAFSGSAVLSGCAAGAGASAQVHRGEQRAVQIGSVSVADVAGAQTAFGLDLLHAMCEELPGENLLLSPTSAGEALGLLYPAAAGRTAEELGSVLHLPAWSPDLVAAMQQHTGAIDGLAFDGDPSSDDAPDFVNMSNRLWTARGLQPEQSYLDDLATAFDAGVEELDFAGDPAGATDRINQSVSDETAGIIDPLFNTALDRRVAAVLTNAVHLKARWDVPFQPAIPGSFASPGGSTTVDMMYGGAGTHREAGGWASVELAYQDGTLAAVAILPPEGSDPCGVESATLADLDAADESPTEVAMPRLHLEQSHELLPALERLGLPTHGDFQRLCDCSVSRVVQRTFLEVDEKGTEAAAATGVVTKDVSLPSVIALDRPFLLVLTDTATGSPLFFAVIYDPSV